MIAAWKSGKSRENDREKKMTTLLENSDSPWGTQQFIGFNQ